MKHEKTRDLVGARRLRGPARSMPISHTPVFKHHVAVGEGESFFHYAVNSGIMLQEPTIEVGRIVGAAEVEVTIVDENGTSHITRGALDEGVNEFPSLTLPPKHKLSVKLVSGRIEDVWITATALKR